MVALRAVIVREQHAGAMMYCFSLAPSSPSLRYRDRCEASRMFLYSALQLFCASGLLRPAWHRRRYYSSSLTRTPAGEVQRFDFVRRRRAPQSTVFRPPAGAVSFAFQPLARAGSGSLVSQRGSTQAFRTSVFAASF